MENVLIESLVNISVEELLTDKIKHFAVVSPVNCLVLDRWVSGVLWFYLK